MYRVCITWFHFLLHHNKNTKGKVTVVPAYATSMFTKWGRAPLILNLQHRRPRSRSGRFVRYPFSSGLGGSHSRSAGFAEVKTVSLVPGIETRLQLVSVQLRSVTMEATAAAETWRFSTLNETTTHAAHKLLSNTAPLHHLSK